ncbi:MAG: hypothetical protein K1566_16920 [Candidatus Thiodiazotropha sp. (ex. Lucinisca nassula)]|nr:hypothetical protein [Candidatus Thiodiazotropha sp. (ex. Lucinisca nassula)]
MSMVNPIILLILMGTWFLAALGAFAQDSHILGWFFLLLSASAIVWMAGQAILSLIFPQLFEN